MSIVGTSVTNAYTIKRRKSIHKNLDDPFLYQIPSPSSSKYHPKDGRQLRDINDFDAFITKLDSIKNELLQNVQSRFFEGAWSGIDYKITVLCLLWYITSSISSNLSKLILYSFPHPVALTELQFLISGVMCLLFTIFVNHLQKPRLTHTSLSRCLNNFPDGILPSYLDGNFNRSIIDKFLDPSKTVFRTTLPLGLFQFVGHVTSHKSTSVIPISLVHSIKALSPIATVLYYKVWKGKGYGRMTYCTLLLLVSGVIITCWSKGGDKASSNTRSEIFLGIFFAFISMIIFVCQSIFAAGILAFKKAEKVNLLPSKNSDYDKSYTHSPLQLDKITILFYCSCIGFLLTLGPFLTNELVQGRGMANDLTWQVFILVLLHGFIHFFQAMLAFQLLGQLSSVTYSIANILKRIVIITAALLWESNLNFRQVFGLVLTVCGLYGYQKWGKSI
ncbi:hypothetical protein KAFR_0D01560 [Kazachstania africana CBS 2517]|uniref:Sugar phosphate transporter domain-containing protein n=1 Tax=Kazachstania africana (strain ATCC 22294 / BCRC 22015 / CBS 2517 / CECT 1963 / NBRC 1671 / NRRL Y-8276) TaxID=1071382 RepID=H2ATV2_KAZAF|nr:hypothetical protein KAFR_0D01560 [Kazachstania africana CBS 2517]CCF57802.1 hypothetical protein KAFR_0D01560 [Kazachstania africana CBS 2517]